MRDREVLERATTPDGREIVLVREAGHLVVRVAGMPLMSSGAHHSEERMAEVGCAGLAGRADARVLVGGLGMGYTLRAALDHLGPTARVVVVEIVPAVVAWNRGPLAPLAGEPLADPRVELVVGDLARYLAEAAPGFDAVLLDVDNGPAALTVRGNRRLYDDHGLARFRRLLRPGGTLVVWSADQHPAFAAALRRVFADARAMRVLSRGRKGSRQTLYVARRTEDVAPAPPPPALRSSRRPGPPPRGGRRRDRGR